MASDEQLEDMSLALDRSATQAGVRLNEWINMLRADLKTLSDVVDEEDRIDLAFPVMADLAPDQARIRSSGKRQAANKLPLGLGACLDNQLFFSAESGVLRKRRSTIVFPFASVTDVDEVVYWNNGSNCPALDVRATSAQAGADHRIALVFSPDFDQRLDRQLVAGRLREELTPVWEAVDCDRTPLPSDTTRCPECGLEHRKLTAYDETGSTP